MIPPHPQAPALNFYPRPPRGGRQPGCRPRCRFSKISIHALREEGDESQHHTVAFPLDFYPRPPRGGRHFASSYFAACRNFYPRPPRGGRHKSQKCGIIKSKFLSTPSARRATNAQGLDLERSRYFYPRPPRGGRQNKPRPFCRISVFLSTPSARRATVHPQH